jgi:hypothetical protein
MFPTIFSLACERLSERPADGSAIMNVEIRGGAIEICHTALRLWWNWFDPLFAGEVRR